MTKLLLRPRGKLAVKNSVKTPYLTGFVVDSGKSMRFFVSLIS